MYMYGLLVGFGLMFDKGQKQSSMLSCDSSYYYIKVGFKGVYITRTCHPDVE